MARTMNLVALSTVAVLAGGCRFPSTLRLDNVGLEVSTPFLLKTAEGPTLRVRMNPLDDPRGEVTIPGVVFRGNNALCGNNGREFDRLMLMADVTLVAGDLAIQASNGEVRLSAEQMQNLSKVPPCIATATGEWADTVRSSLRMARSILTSDRADYPYFQDEIRIYQPSGRNTLAVSMTFEQGGRKLNATFDTGVAARDAESMLQKSSHTIPARVSGQAVDLRVERTRGPWSESDAFSYETSCTYRTTRVICVSPTDPHDHHSTSHERCRTVTVYEPGHRLVTSTGTRKVSQYRVLFQKSGVTQGMLTFKATVGGDSFRSEGTCLPGEPHRG